MKQFRTLRLNAFDSTQKITTPNGKVMSAKAWANQLQLNYNIAVVFYDTKGKEVHRIDSEFGKDRFEGSMNYVLTKAYLRHQQFLRWRREQARSKSKQQKL